MQLVDTHCHLTALDHAPLADILANARKASVTRFVCIGAGDGTAAAEKAVELASAHEDIWASIGIHPHDAGMQTHLSGFEKYLTNPKVVAIGETGLDFFRDWAPRENQFELFEASINFAKAARKPLIIHCRTAAAETLEMLQVHHAEEVGGVFHCYAEDADFAAKLRDINFLVSFPGSLTFKSAHELRETAKLIPLEQIMLETDAPYMAPEPFRGKPSEPMHVYQVARKLAEVKGVTIEEIAEVTTKNAARLFGLKT